jgi:hypothetical protein
MRFALHSTLAASKKEPLGEMIDRIHSAFLQGGMPEPAIRFQLADSFLPNTVSAVDRVLKRHPEMERFLADVSHTPPHPQARRLTNLSTSEPAEYAILQAIAAGVPRSYPFRTVSMHFHAPAFGAEFRGAFPKVGNSLPGVWATDNWWVNGRQRALYAYTAVEGESGGKKLPPIPEPVAGVISACGKIRSIKQVGLLVMGGGAPLISAASAQAVDAVVADYRARMKEIVERAGLPHRLPPAIEAQSQNAGVQAGPRKPPLEAIFKPMGYDCRGGSGEFHVSRQTEGKLTVELFLDVGTWSHEVSAVFLVKGLAFNASLAVPVAQEVYGQYPIGDAAQWQKIVENLAAMVRELERSFVPEIEQAAGPSPEWYRQN